MLARFEVAFQFLTILPFFRARHVTSEELARSMGAFPLVGLVLGAGLAGFHWMVGRHLPGLLEGAVLAALLAWATGGFHLDGLADTFDALGGGWTSERALEIMKDSRVGALGAAGLGLTLLLKVAALGTLPAEFAARAIFVFPAVARGGVVWVAFGSRYARATPGLGTPYTEHLDRSTLNLALLGSALSSLLLGWQGALAFAATLAYAHWVKTSFHRRLGGVTGDVLGFAEETGEVLFLLSLHVLV